jgi:hypothetical protein
LKDQGNAELDFSKPADVDTATTVLATRNGKGVGYILTDYPDAFGGKNIVKVHVWNMDSTSVGFELAYAQFRVEAANDGLLGSVAVEVRQV